MERTTLPFKRNKKVKQVTKKKNDHVLSLNSQALENVYKSIKNINANNDGVMQLFPDVGVTIDTGVANILSTEDMSTTVLHYTSKSRYLSTLTKSAMSIAVSDYIEGSYSIIDDLEEIVKEAKYTRGGYARLTVAIDVVEQLDKEAKKVISLESADEIVIDAVVNEKPTTTTFTVEDKDVFMEVTNDVNAMSRTVKEDKELSLEENHKGNLVKKTLMEFIALNNSLGTKDGCVRLKVPIELVLPITASNDPSNHLGYFILTDKMNNIVKKDMFDRHNPLKQKLLGDNELVKKARANLGMTTAATPGIDVDESLYINILRDKLDAKLDRLGVKETSGFKINNDFFRVLMQRSLKKLETKVLYVTNEQLTYYAFNYRSNGTGESLLERVAVLASMRGIAMMARSMANVRNSIPNTVYKADIPEEDLDPLATTEAITAEAMNSAAGKMPLGSSNITDLLTWVTTAGISVRVQSPSLPALTIESEEVYTNYDATGARELEDDLREEMIIALGSTVDIIDGVSDENFAASVYTNNAMRRRKTLADQKILAKHVTNDVKSIANADVGVRNTLRETVSENYTAFFRALPKDLKKLFRTNKVPKLEIIEWMITEYLDTFNVAFPAITVDSDAGLNKAFKEYKENIDEAIESWFSEDMLPEELVGETDDDVVSKLDEIKTALTHTLLREWMTANKYIPELSDSNLFEDEDGKPRIHLLDMHADYTDSLVKGISKYLKDTGALEDDGDGKEEVDDDNGDYGEKEEEEKALPEEKVDDSEGTPLI